MADIDPNAIKEARAAGYSDAEIADHIAKDPGVKAAREAGYSDKEIIAHIAGDKPEASGAAAGLSHGTEQAINSLKETGKDYFGVGDGPTATTDPNYVPANITNGSANPLNWNYSQLPQKAAEIAPGLAQNIVAATAGAKAGKAIGGVRGAALGGFLASMASLWGSSAGDAAKKDAEARTGNPDATPEAQDLTRAGLTSAASSAVQAALPTRFIPGANNVTGVGAQGALDGIKKYLATTALAGGTGAAGNVIDQAGNSVGTKDGLKVDWGQVGDAGLGNAAAAGMIGAPRALADVTGAATRAKFGGENAAATAAYAKRLSDASGDNGLGTGVFGAGKRDYAAHDNTKAGLRKELQDVDHSSMDQDTQNALSLARSGKPITTDDVAQIESADPAAGFLARQLHVAQQAEKFGTYDPTNKSWTGGVSGKMDKLIRNYVDPTKVAVGAAAGKVLGLHLLGTASPAFAGAAAGTYGLARAADAMSGMRSPARQFADRFQQAQTATRMPPPQAPQAPAPQPAAPWGPRPPQPSVPQVAPPAAPGIDATTQNADIQGMLRMAMARRNVAAQQAAASAPATPAPMDANAQNADIQGMLRMAAARRAIAGRAQAENLAQDSHVINDNGGLDALSNPAFGKRASQLLAAANARARLTAEPEPEPAPAPAPAPQAPAAPPAPQQAPVPPPAPAPAPAAPQPSVPPQPAPTAPAVMAQVNALTPGRITKTKANGKVHVEAPKADPWEGVGSYDPSGVQNPFHGMAPAQMAQISAAALPEAVPAINRASYYNNVLQTRTARDNTINALKQQHPAEQSIMDELRNALHAPGNSDQAMSRRAIKHYASLMSPDAGHATRATFDRADVKDAIWPSRKRSTKKKANGKTEAPKEEVRAN